MRSIDTAGRICAGLLTITYLLIGSGPRAAAAPTKRLVAVAWDGAADWIVDRLLAEGRLPHVARLAQMGLQTEYVIPAWPSKTAAGFAALWTGAYGDVNRITGNGIPLLPRAEHTILEVGPRDRGSPARRENAGQQRARRITR